ncbi:hypothetical protein X777_08980 [Ooceraea biroi]|uniref:Uncharacterized protein n=1 Tax=Ooceraea biroi TaxID=2015173 RepID=A0A026W8C6_OOCBI|nr:hypothetical protein X777_08980 [Ooceraea biroi]
MICTFVQWIRKSRACRVRICRGLDRADRKRTHMLACAEVLVEYRESASSEQSAAQSEDRCKNATLPADL